MKKDKGAEAAVAVEEAKDSSDEKEDAGGGEDVIVLSDSDDDRGAGSKSTKNTKAKPKAVSAAPVSVIKDNSKKTPTSEVEVVDDERPDKKKG